jgi:glycosyltransferase involved in cell wall biosynthesis
LEVYKKRIAIDARFYGPKQKGLGRYCQKLVENLEKLEKDNQENQYYILLRKENYDDYQPKNKNFHRLVADFKWYSFKEQTSFLFFLNKQKFDLIHFCHFNVPLFYGGKFVVTIHDLILLHYPTPRNTTLNKYFYFFKLWAYRRVIKNCVKKAKKILAVSEFTKKDIVQNLGTRSDKIKVALEGCDLKCRLGRSADSEILEKYGIIKPYLLYVGNAYPHKNLFRLCQAFRMIRKVQPQMNLVLVGGKDFFYERLRREVLEQKMEGIFFAGHVQDGDLDVVYKNARLYVFPSLYEGFGLPSLEALAKGVPVVSSGRTSMAEILGQAALYFDPEDIESIFRSINSALEDSRLCDKLVQVGQKRLEKFSWQKMAKETLEVYRECLK